MRIHAGGQIKLRQVIRATKRPSQRRLSQKVGKATLVRGRIVLIIIVDIREMPN